MKKYFKKVLDKLSNLRYYVKADPHGSLTESLQSLYRFLTEGKAVFLEN